MGRGRVVHTGEGREICKIRMAGKIKFKAHTHNNCLYGSKIYPEVRELQCPLQNTKIHTNDLKILDFNQKYQILDLQIILVPALHQGTIPVLHSGLQ